MKNFIKTMGFYLGTNLKFLTPIGVMELTRIETLGKHNLWFTTDSKIDDEEKDFNYKLLIKEGLGGVSYTMKEAKPFLYPLEMIKEEINYKNQMILPARELFSLSVRDEEILLEEGKLPEYIETMIAEKSLSYWDFSQVRLLIDLHFDIAKLIDNEAAVNKKDINKFLTKEKQ